MVDFLQLKKKLCPVNGFVECRGVDCGWWDEINLASYGHKKVYCGCYKVVRNHIEKFNG